MAATYKVFPSLTLNALTENGGGTASTPVKLQSDTLQVLLVGAGTFNWVASTQAYTTVHDFLTNAGAGGGGALTEVTGGSYARKTLAGVNPITNSANITTLTCTSPSWTSATFTAYYALFFDNTIGGTDTTNQIISYWDFGGVEQVTSGTYTLTVGVNGIAQWTH